MVLKNRKKSLGRKSKRWHAEASFGDTVPFLGGSKISLGTRAVKAIVKREISKEAETKVAYDTGAWGANLKNESWYTIMPWANIPEGVDSNDRVGQEIMLKKILIEGYIGYYSGAPITMRMIVFWSTRDLPAPAGTNILGEVPTVVPPVTGSTPVGDTTLFYNGGGQPRTFWLINNRLGNTVVCDELFTVGPKFSGESVTRKFNYSCDLNKKVKYASSTPPSTFEGKQLYCAFVFDQPGTGYGSLISMNFGINTIVTFKDL